MLTVLSAELSVNGWRVCVCPHVQHGGVGVVFAVHGQHQETGSEETALGQSLLAARVHVHRQKHLEDAQSYTRTQLHTHTVTHAHTLGSSDLQSSRPTGL